MLSGRQLEKLKADHTFYHDQAYENIRIAMTLDSEQGQLVRALNFYDLGVRHIHSALQVPISQLSEQER